MEPTTTIETSSIFDDRQIMDTKIVIDRSSIAPKSSSRNSIAGETWTLHRNGGRRIEEEENQPTKNEEQQEHHHHLHKRKASSDDSESSECSLTLLDDDDEDEGDDIKNSCSEKNLTKAEIYSLERLNKIIMNSTTTSTILPPPAQEKQYNDFKHVSSTANDSLLALANQIGASSISGRTQDRQNNNDDIVLPSPRKYQRRNSFVIRRNRTQRYMFPPIHFANDYDHKNKSQSSVQACGEESFHQSLPELFLSSPTGGDRLQQQGQQQEQEQQEQEGIGSSTSLLSNASKDAGSTNETNGGSSTSSLAVDEWGNASWSNSSDTEWYQQSSSLSMMSSPVGQEAPSIIPMPLSSNSSKILSNSNSSNSNVMGVMESVPFPYPPTMTKAKASTTTGDEEEVHA